MAQQRQDCYFAVTQPGLEEICCLELKALGITPTRQLEGGVEFFGGLRELYLANLWLRTASRILVRVGEVRVRDFPSLYQRLVKLPWGRYLQPGHISEVRASCHRSRLRHTGRVAETVQAAIAQSLGMADVVQDDGPLIIARLDEDLCQLSVDSSGELLHRRGYRQTSVRAPLRETLAAATLLALKWDGRIPLVDGMTGSGTFAIEAALLAEKRPPGEQREFAFMRWPRFRPGLWHTLLQQAGQQRDATGGPLIKAVDSNPDAIAAARENAATAGVSDRIDFRVQSMESLQPGAPSGLILCNPPYGERLGRDSDLAGLYQKIGAMYRGVFCQWQAALLCPRNELARATKVNWSKVLQFNNGGLKISLLQRNT